MNARVERPVTREKPTVSLAAAGASMQTVAGRTPGPAFIAVRQWRLARSLRLFLGNDDSINLVCDAQGIRRPWVYQLVGDFDKARDWTRNRTDDAPSLSAGRASDDRPS